MSSPNHVRDCFRRRSCIPKNDKCDIRHLTIELRNTAWASCDNGEDPCFVFWIVTITTFRRKATEAVSDKCVRSIVLTNRQHNRLVTSRVVRSHLDVHKQFHTTPKASTVRRATDYEELLASRQEYRQALQVRHDIGLIDTHFV